MMDRKVTFTDVFPVVKKQTFEMIKHIRFTTKVYCMFLLLRIVDCSEWMTESTSLELNSTSSIFFKQCSMFPD